MHTFYLCYHLSMASFKVIKMSNIQEYLQLHQYIVSRQVFVCERSGREDIELSVDVL